jgi:RNA polymerase sigma factor (sigma-70 family)
MDVISEYKRSMSEAIALSTDEPMIVQNLPLVVFLAKKFLNKYPGMDIDDLIGWGNIGLCKAADKFDETREIRFSTYAATIIHREFLRCMVDVQNRGCRLPRKTYEQVQIVATYVAEFGRVPPLQELESRLERKTPLSRERYKEILNAYRSSLPYAGEIKEELLANPEEDEDDDE